MPLAGAGRAILSTFIRDAENGLERGGVPIEELSHDQWLAAQDVDRSLPEVRRTIDRVAAILG